MQASKARNLEKNPLLKEGHGGAFTKTDQKGGDGGLFSNRAAKSRGKIARENRAGKSRGKIAREKKRPRPKASSWEGGGMGEISPDPDAPGGGGRPAGPKNFGQKQRLYMVFLKKKNDLIVVNRNHWVWDFFSYADKLRGRCDAQNS